MEETKKLNNGQSDDFIEFSELILLCVKHWRWFALSFFVMMCFAAFYILRTPATYKRTAEVQIKSETSGGPSLSIQRAFSDMGGMLGMKPMVTNELRALLSADVMFDVVRRLNLDKNYYMDGTFHDATLYGKTLPVTISFLDLTDDDNVACDIIVDSTKTVQLNAFLRYEKGKKVEIDECVTGHFGDTLSTPLGKVIVVGNSEYEGGQLPVIHLFRSDLFSSQENWSRSLKVTQEEEKADIITLEVTDVSPERGDDILDMVIKVYNENWIKDKNTIADGTSMFINERLKIIESELSTVDNDISSYKSKNLLPDVKAVADMYMQENANISNQLRDLNAQLYMTNYIRDYLSVQKNQTSTLPASSGLNNTNIERQISEYNEKMMQRNRLEESSSSENVWVVQYDKELGTMRKAILVSIDNQIAAIDNQVRNLKKSEQKALSHISSNPKQAEMLLSAERQQAVKEALYLFLLQKREENELSQSFNAYNTRMIKRPGGSTRPDGPSKRNIVLLTFALALFLPISIIYLKETFNTTLRGKKDLENVPVPLFGEIPMAKQTKKWWQFWRKDPKELDTVVEDGNRNTINEAFRLLRTNLDFTMEKGKNVVMFTSFNAESGKSFLCLNTALSIAFKNQRILVIDGDMRHASMSKWAGSPEKGLSAYLSGKENNIANIIVKSVNDKAGLDLIPVGDIPNNPSELIGSEKLGELIDKMKGEYDYVFIDCPPIDVVADARIIEKYVDITMFSIRVGLLDRSLLDDLAELYNENKIKNMHLILNGTPLDKGKYSYRNSYHSSTYFSRG